MSRDGGWVLPDDMFDDPEEDEPDEDCIPWGAPTPKRRDVGFARRFKQLMEKRGEM